MSREPRPRQPQERPGPGDARGPGHRRSEQGDRRRLDGRAGRRRGPLRAVGPDRHRRSSLADGQPVDLIVQLDPEQTRRRSRSSRRCPVGTVAKVPLGTIATVEQVDVQGSITRIDQAPAATITAEITSDDTGARVAADVQADDRRARRRRAHPGRRRRPAGRRDRAAERGVRRPVHLDGRRRSCWST